MPHLVPDDFLSSSAGLPHLLEGKDLAIGSLGEVLGKIL